MELNALLSAGFLLSALTYIGYQLKSVPEIIWRFIKRKITYSLTVEETDELYLYLERWLTENYKSNYRNVEASLSPNKINGGGEVNYLNSPNYEHDYEPGDAKSDVDKLYIWQYQDTFIIRYNGRRLLIDKSRDKLEGAKTLKNAFFNKFTISGIFAKTQILNLLSDVVEYNQKFKKERLPRVFTNSSWGEWQYNSDIKTKNINNVFIKGKDFLINDIKGFITNEEWYNKRGIPYKRGYIFYGEPGNGKTATVQAIAREFKKDVYYMSLNSLEDDTGLLRLFSNIRGQSIVVLEDVDAYFEGRKNNKENGISFSALLNCLDGTFSKSGIMLFMTTNHIDKLDPALIRPGRVDVKLEISNPKREHIIEYLKNFYEVENIEGLDGYVEFSKPMVKIQDICLTNKYSIIDAIKEIVK
jgi:mitochondrial chaperone BCS1